MNLQKVRYQVLITVIFGSLAYLTRALNLITPLGGVFVLDLRDFFVAIGAAIGGLGPGFVIGLLAGIPAKVPIIDIASFCIAGAFVGFFSTYFYKRKINVAFSALFMLTGYAVALLLVWYYGLMQVSLYLVLRALICTPINIFILNNLFNTYPRILAAARYH
ncbi:MAG: hypothetical protein MUC66_08985 [Methanolinea sp.]|jgi:hypothetical protein|nr:hypothetical protein [Methanolinea sp.]